MSNPYVDTLIESGYDKLDLMTEALKPQFPCVIHGRKYETEDEYNEALHDFLNGQ